MQSTPLSISIPKFILGRVLHITASLYTSYVIYHMPSYLYMLYVIYHISYAMLYILKSNPTFLPKDRLKNLPPLKQLYEPRVSDKIKKMNLFSSTMPHSNNDLIEFLYLSLQNPSLYFTSCNSCATVVQQLCNCCATVAQQLQLLCNRCATVTQLL